MNETIKHAARMLKLLAFAYVPGLYKLIKAGGGDTASARYCYSAWMRHLVMAYERGLDTNPAVVAELGPGYSIGMGLCALMTGAEKYYALDVVEYRARDVSVKLFDELADILSRRERIPDNEEFPNLKPGLSSYDFPDHILSPERMKSSLDPGRMSSLKNALRKLNDNERNEHIFYIVPWHDAGVIRNETVDMVFSQAVLEHVTDLRGTHKAQYLWLKPGGFISHQIDFKSHGVAREWNGHWKYSDLRWKIITGKRDFLINRRPHSEHVASIKENGFDILFDLREHRPSKVQRRHLAGGFKEIDEDDLTTSAAFIQAIKRT